jgi:hypothetical protein
MRRVLLAIAICAGTASADSVVTSVEGDASASVISVALLDGFSISGTSSAESVYQPNAPAIADATETEILMAFGGTGPGFLQLQFFLTGDAEGCCGGLFGGSVEGGFSVAGEGDFCPSYGGQEIGCDSTSPYFYLGYPIFATVPFIFGVPSSVTQDLQGAAYEYDGYGFATFEFQSSLYSYSVTDQNGSPIADATVSQAPEPSCFWSTGLLLVLVAWTRKRRLRFSLKNE